MEKLSGPFKDIIPILQNYKKSIGYKYDNINNYILIDKILKDNNITSFKNSKKIYDILINHEYDKKKQRRNYFILKELYSFMYIIGYNDLYFEKKYFHSNNNTTKPISLNDLQNFFIILDEYCEKMNDTILPVLFRLIYSSGLRISEAINIKIDDFNKEKGTITIVQGKNNITRILPLSDTMLSTLDKYFKINILTDNTYLFEYKQKKLRKDYIEKKFNLITSILGFKSKVHALRFTFAVNTLDNLYKNKINSKEILYPLSLYMGHNNIESTEYYLQFTKEYFVKYVKNILPKRSDNNEV